MQKEKPNPTMTNNNYTSILTAIAFIAVLILNIECGFGHGTARIVKMTKTLVTQRGARSLSHSNAPEIAQKTLPHLHNNTIEAIPKTLKGDTTKSTHKPLQQLHSDTLTMKHERVDKSNAFYDTLRYGSQKSWLGQSLGRWLVSGRRPSEFPDPKRNLELSQQYYSSFRDRTIVAINVVRSNVFERTDQSDESQFEKNLNKLHIVTRESQLRQNLLFRVGDKLNPYTMTINEQLLRELPYLSWARIVVVPDIYEPDKVIVTVFTRDAWSIIADTDISSTSSVRIADQNFLGTGSELSIRYLPKQGRQDIGIENRYTIENLLGTFAKVELAAGFGHSNDLLEATVSRSFILPSDHFWGATFGQRQSQASMKTVDTTLAVNRHYISGWLGRSFKLDFQRGVNFYVAGAGYYNHFTKRPTVEAQLNPYYHNQKVALISFGVARQNYFKGNMIYSFGRVEDIPFGYKIEYTTGITWNEFNGRRYYIGGNVGWADQFKFGYINASLRAATYFDDNQKRTQGLIHGRIQYFSPLWHIGRYYMRHIINISVVGGANRFDGDNEVLSYTEAADVLGVKLATSNLGYNRLTIRSENVLFSPLFFYHFRFSFSAWADAGWLGNNNNMFKNESAVSTGIGIRIRNDRLIFNSLSIRVGLALRMPADAHYNPFRIRTNESPDFQNFKPSAPAIAPYI